MVQEGEVSATVLQTHPEEGLEAFDLGITNSESLW